MTVRRTGLIAAVALVALAVGCGGASTPATSSAAPVPTTTTEPGTPAPSSPSSSGPAVTPVAACDTDYLARFSPRQKLAQLLTVGVTGTADAVNVVTSEQVGGIFFGSWTDSSLLTGGGVAQAQAAAIAPLMVTIDEEGGRVSRAGGLIGSAPSARDVAATMTVDQAYQQALDRGRQLRALGVTVNFAPDVDVSSQPADSVIGDRSYSSDPNRVTEYAGAVIRGYQDAGLGAVMKHFPGHGSGSGDSHTGAVTTPPLAQLQTSDLVPFRNLIGSGAAVMVGHLDVPGLTAPGVPASVSPEAMTLLRTGVMYGAAPYNGPIFTDDLGGMAAITDRYSIPGAVEASLVAGADVALWITTDQVPAVLDQLEQAVAAGRLSQLQVDQSMLRVARYKGALTC
ncbi:MAG TPA: glycoside hydrolase family 3 N-terminal domain-containing protein [Aldersonia sp.]